MIKPKAQRALEMGTSNGCSGIWIATGLTRQAGILLTLEIDEGRAKLAQENFKAAALDSLIELKLGDALREIPKLKGPHDFVFIDADKSDYLRVSTGLKGSQFRQFGGSQRSSVSVSGHTKTRAANTAAVPYRVSPCLFESSH